MILLSMFYIINWQNSIFVVFKYSVLLIQYVIFIIFAHPSERHRRFDLIYVKIC